MASYSLTIFLTICFMLYLPQKLWHCSQSSKNKVCIFHGKRSKKAHFLLSCHWLSQALIIRILDIYEALFCLYYCFRCLLTDAARQFTLMCEFASISVIISKSKSIRKRVHISLSEYIFSINSVFVAFPLACCHWRFLSFASALTEEYLKLKSRR